MSHSLKHQLFTLGFIFFSSTTFINSNTHALTEYRALNYLNGDTAMYEPLKNITWTKVRNYGDVQDIGSPHYFDVVAHTNPNDPDCPRSSGMAFAEASVRVHETEHMLAYQIRRLSNANINTVEGLYYGNGNGIIFVNPKAKVTDFVKLIPTELREAPSPYQTYIIEQLRYIGLDNIGYLFNEWAAYRSNIIVNLELENAGIPEDERGGHAANYSPHFFGYLAIAMHHLRTAEPTALNDRQLKAAFALYAESTWKLMYEALNSPVFGTDDTYNGSRIRKLIDFYRNSPKFADVRNSLIAIYGKPWVDTLMK